MKRPVRLNNMKDGWTNDNYVIFFDDDESLSATEAYDLKRYIPNHRIIAIWGWDNFILKNAADEVFLVPTIPLDKNELEPFNLEINPEQIVPDDKFAGKIKWYTKPIIFGGDPNTGENLTWIDLQSHQKLVCWWNQRYYEIKNK